MQKHDQHTKTETSNGMKYVVGIDEVGRGALAGPVAVGAVLMPADLSWDDFENLKDSKKLSEKKREEWFEIIRTSDVLAFGVEMMGSEFIDKEGIVPACACAAHKIITHFDVDIDEVNVLCDAGLSVPKEWNQESIVRGDEKEASIALASIVAKVTRDRYMREYAKRYSAYGFEKNKGYGTKAHRISIQEKGHIPGFHRISFLGNILAKSRGKTLANS